MVVRGSAGPRVCVPCGDLDVAKSVALSDQRRELTVLAPVEEHPQVGLGVLARRTR